MRRVGGFVADILPTKFPIQSITRDAKVKREMALVGYTTGFSSTRRYGV